MSDGPSPESTRGVDSSREAIAAMVVELQRFWREIVEMDEGESGQMVMTRRAAALLAQVARERDEAEAQSELRRQSIDGLANVIEAERARAAAAERQLAEARAALAMATEALRDEITVRMGDGSTHCSNCHASRLDPGAPITHTTECVLTGSRALLSGETTRVEDEG